MVLIIPPNCLGQDPTETYYFSYVCHDMYILYEFHEGIL